ncbi:Protein phosphatase 1 regulatory subunit 3A [Bagarius yarrelli]|uniref:Protein phosphatase 1 regulatory subunit 3A n=1 Tax=Bagarius yarrelli TaxID=175774 RepID=A0A556U7Z1_BAGYA|nr:Protein phosphatase 1 regulatory subunit 3A [Bagarius yarrelli]
MSDEAAAPLKYSFTPWIKAFNALSLVGKWVRGRVVINVRKQGASLRYQKYLIYVLTPGKPWTLNLATFSSVLSEQPKRCSRVVTRISCWSLEIGCSSAALHCCYAVRHVLRTHDRERHRYLGKNKRTMAQGNQFLNIPKQEGYFLTIKSVGETRDDSPFEDEDEEETEEDVRLIPRCSPIPRKRGPSIADETAEYMRIRLALPQRRVSFADTSGSELVNVREFAAFDSSDEDDNANWEEEEAKYRRAYHQPVYRLWPEFQALAGNDLTLAVRANKVEVEKVTAVEDEPLAFHALICVLNVSYHKCVYVRSTMDGWITHTDTAAQYVQDSHDGDTDKFSVRLSFAEPYVFNGARIDFVVRYETSDGEFWANNSGRNYSVTLIISYEEDTAPVNKVDEQEVKGILKPPRYRAVDDADFYSDTDEGNENNTEGDAAAAMFIPVCPLVIEPEIDIEIPEAQSALSKTKTNPTLAECPLLCAERKDKNPQDLPETTLQTDHPEKDQGTELLMPSQNVTAYLQKNDAQESKPANSNSHFMQTETFSPKHFCSNQEPPQSSMFPSIQVISDDGLEDPKQTDVKESEERRETQLRDQTSDVMEVDKNESSQEPRESTPQCSSNKLITANESKSKGHSTEHDTLFEESHEPFLENPEMQLMKHDTMIRRESSGKENTDLKVGEVADIIASCMWQPFIPTDLGQTREESGNQNVPRPPRVPDPEVIEYQEQHQVPECKLKENYSVNRDTQYGSENTASEEKSQILTSVSSATATSQRLTTTEQTVPPKGGDGEPSMTQKEPLPNDKMYNDPATFQKSEELEHQHALPCETLEASNPEVNVILNTLIPSFACLCATVCLIVGFYEPSTFFIMALFLVSLCF